MVGPTHTVDKRARIVLCVTFHGATVHAMKTLAGVAVVVVAAFAGSTVAAAGGNTPAEALEPPTPVDDTVVDDGTVDDDTVVIETFSATGTLLTVEAFDEQGTKVPVPAFDLPARPIPTAGKLTGPDGPGGITTQGSGTGGASSASGCRRVTVNNEKESTFGATLYYFHTWTNWCWNRTNKTVSSVTTGWSLSQVDWAQEWRGVINDTRYFYAWQSGASKSGYFHEKIGHFVNCLGPVCGAQTYPKNTLRSYSNGTWSWNTSG